MSSFILLILRAGGLLEMHNRGSPDGWRRPSIDSPCSHGAVRRRQEQAGHRPVAQI